MDCAWLVIGSPLLILVASRLSISGLEAIARNGVIPLGDLDALDSGRFDCISLGAMQARAHFVAIGTRNAMRLWQSAIQS